MSEQPREIWNPRGKANVTTVEYKDIGQENVESQEGKEKQEGKSFSAFIYLFIYLFNFANKHLQGEHTKKHVLNIWQETHYSFCHLQWPLQKDTTNSK